MKRTPVTSSTIRSIGHENGVMDVEFINGGVYRYSGPKVTAHYEGLMAAGSKGNYFAQNVRRCKDTHFTKLPPDEETASKK